MNALEVGCEVALSSDVAQPSTVDVQSMLDAVETLSNALASHRAGRQREALKLLDDVNRHRVEHVPAWVWVRAARLRERVRAVIRDAGSAAR